jgi:hypothetical protein
VCQSKKSRFCWALAYGPRYVQNVSEKLNTYNSLMADQILCACVTWVAVEREIARASDSNKERIDASVISRSAPKNSDLKRMRLDRAAYTRRVILAQARFQSAEARE